MISLLYQAFHFCCESMPMFNNLLNLSIESDKEKGWQVMPLLLNSCPNLHTLVIKVFTFTNIVFSVVVVVSHYTMSNWSLLISGSCAQSNK